MKLIYSLYRPSLRFLLIATLCGVISGLCGAGIIATIGKGVSGKGHLATLGATFLALCLLQFVSKSYSQICLVHSTQAASAGLRLDLSRKILATSLKQQRELGKPALFVILTKDIEILIAAFQGVPAAFGNVIVISTCLAYMAWLSWQMFVVFAVCLCVGVFGYHLAQKAPIEQMKIVRQNMDKLYAHFRNLIEGSKELKLNEMRGRLFVDTVLAPSTEEYRQSYTKGMRGFIFVVNTGTVSFLLVIGMSLFVLPHWLPQPASVLTTCTIILLYLANPISEIIQMIPSMGLAAISLKRIEQLEGSLGDDHPEPAGAPHFSQELPLRLELRGVCHQYPSATDNSQFMLGPIDLTIHQGESIFIVGGNGSGKTTLAMLLLGLFEPEVGCILLNGEPITLANAAAYRQHFSAVFSDFHLFEQLLIADQDNLSDRASHYVNRFNMAHKVKVDDGKFSTIDLSTGQRKRLALVSSYLEDRPVYLFDEWAADQDPVFKKVFYTELLPELQSRGKTVIVITHDDSYFGFADRIIKLQDGQLLPVTAEAAPEQRQEYPYGKCN
jgi:putative ATP-binding cassette transporter